MIKLIFFTCVFRLSQAEQHYDFLVHRQRVEATARITWLKKNTFDLPRLDTYDRITLLCRQIYEDAVRRVVELNDMRYMYEETREYESGYIMGEIIERYRKLMEEGRMVYANLKRKYGAQRHATPDLLNRVEKAQQLYFEEYHLVRMMNEIIPKYKKSKGAVTAKMPTPAVGATASLISAVGATASLISIVTTPKSVDDENLKKIKEKLLEKQKQEKDRLKGYEVQIWEHLKDKQSKYRSKKPSYYNYSVVERYTRRPWRSAMGLPFDYGWEIGYLYK